MAHVRKAYQPDFLLPTYEEIKSYVEKEWQDDMDKIESDAQEYLDSQEQGMAGEVLAKAQEEESAPQDEAAAQQGKSADKDR